MFKFTLTNLKLKLVLFFPFLYQRIVYLIFCIYWNRNVYFLLLQTLDCHIQVFLLILYFFCSLTNLLKILFLGSHHLFLMLVRVQSVFFYVLQLHLLLDFQLFLFVFWMLSQEVNSMVSSHFWTPKPLDFIPCVGSSFYKKLFSCISHLQLLM